MKSRIDREIDVTAIEPNGWNTLVDVAMNENLEAMKLLLTRQIDRYIQELKSIETIHTQIQDVLYLGVSINDFSSRIQDITDIVNNTVLGAQGPIMTYLTAQEACLNTGLFSGDMPPLTKTQILQILQFCEMPTTNNVLTMNSRTTYEGESIFTSLAESISNIGTSNTIDYSLNSSTVYSSNTFPGPYTYNITNVPDVSINSHVITVL